MVDRFGLITGPGAGSAVILNRRLALEQFGLATIRGAVDFGIHCVLVR
jgi:hypothetical protein